MAPSCQGLRARLRDDRGVTLIELLTVMAMLGIALTATFFFYQAVVNRTTDTQERRNTLADQRVALERMVRDIRAADRVTAPTAGATANGLQLNVLDGSGGAATVVAYDCEGVEGACTRSVGGGTPSAVIEGLEPSAEPVFTVGSDGHWVRVSLQAVPEGRTRPIILSRGVTLRNFCTQLPEPEECNV